MFDRKEYYKQYYQKNKEKIKSYIEKYQNSDKGQTKIKEYRKKYYQRPDVKKKQKEYDKKRYNSQNKIYRQINKQINLCIKVFCKKGDLNIREIVDLKYKTLYGIDLKSLVLSLRPFPKNLNGYSLDHIIPIKNFDLNKKEEIVNAYKRCNLQFIPIKDNQKKGSKF